ncbi:Oidioi.mRNA.OKI2018_I69.PAR.g11165.t1.cds [Oikopleura dioica]|uniref:Oidioi.mRNA.OKI2018_I69.PAR.g11165.t1.cds n=1 Tax=Oikopleura dioica TaxID=34765 RepID=A0ABN7S178_OIKDI|nr:Oidioi.mRNA.OKI2018_I69.PAR.g11165.t1.cds [Oikopleura dioica]
MTVREEREARVDIQQMIQSANELLDSAGLPEQPLQQEMMEAGQNNEPENSDSESDDSSLQNSSSDEYVEGDISLDDIMPAALARRIRRHDEEREVPERINVREAELKKKAEEAIKKSFPEESPLKKLFTLPSALRSRCAKRPRTGSFQNRVYLDAAYKFSDTCMTELTGHTGCVNALGWSGDDQFIVSGSDDKCINLYKAMGKEKKPQFRFYTGHQSNIFQSKFIPYQTNRKIVSCSRDGAVRLTELDNGGCPVRLSEEEPTKLLVKHRLSAHKLAFVHGTSVILSAGEDGRIYQIDHREPPKNPIIRLDDKVMYAIDCQPNGYEFAVCGDFAHAKIFDRRYLTSEMTLGSSENNAHSITCLRYNHTGTELLLSYQNGEIHLMNINEKKVINTFTGHQNEQTIKGVNFYGKNCEYVISGSDCGRFYIWDSKTGALVNSQFADGTELSPGVVNVLEPAKSIPMLATSGLDSEVKLWTPSDDVFLEDEDRVSETKDQMTENINSGRASRRARFSFLDRLRLLEYMARRERAADDSSDSDEDTDDDEEEGDRGCRQM